MLQFIGCLGVLLWSVLGCCEQPWQLYLQFVLISLGVFGARLWTALLALSLYLLRTRSLCFVLKLRPYFAAIGWGIPALIAVVLSSTVRTESDHTVKIDPNFQYGRTQAIVAVVVLISSFITTLVCLILQQRYGKRYNEYQSLLSPERRERSYSVASASTTSIRDVEDNTTFLTRRESTDSRAGDFGHEATSRRDLDRIDEQPEPSTDLFSSSDGEGKDLLFSPTSDFCKASRCDTRQRQQCDSLMRRYRSRSVHQLTEPEEVNIVRDRDDEYQMLRHVVLLLILCCSMFVVSQHLCTGIHSTRVIPFVTE